MRERQCLKNKKKLNSLLDDLERSLAINGERHHDTAEIYIKIGRFYSLKTPFSVNREEFLIALEHYHKGLVIYEKLFGDYEGYDLKTSELYCDIAELYGLLNNPSEALEFYHKGLPVYLFYLKKYGEGH